MQNSLPVDVYVTLVPLRSFAEFPKPVNPNCLFNSFVLVVAFVI